MPIEAPNTQSVWLFFRKKDDGIGESFYLIHPSPKCVPEDHAKLNPGTLRIEDAVTGKVLWSAPAPPSQEGR
jgi:hypothetical protein